MTEYTPGKPSWSLLDRSKKYTNAASTDLRRVFARIRFDQQMARRELEEQAHPLTLRAVK